MFNGRHAPNEGSPEQVCRIGIIGSDLGSLELT